MRTLAAEVRSLLVDAGYPAERSWRALEAAFRTLDQESDDAETRVDALDELQEAVSGLEAMLQLPSQRDVDLHIVG
jgi:hypothetical protein